MAGKSSTWLQLTALFRKITNGSTTYESEPCTKPLSSFHIAIVGAGIGGLALAIALERQDVPYTIYESASSYATVGAGVGIGPNAMRAMDQIDKRFRVEYDKVCIGNLTPGKEHVMMEATMIEDGFGVKDGVGMRPWGSPTYTRTAAHRKDLLDIMTALIPQGSVKFNKRVAEISELDNTVELCFADGERATASAVIGCDGIKGFTRGCVLSSSYPDEVTPKYADSYAYRAIIPIEDARRILGNLGDDARMYFGRDINLSTYVISQGREINLVAFIHNQFSWEDTSRVTRQVTREEMVADLTSRGVDERLVKLLEWAQPTQWAMFHHPKTSTYYHGLICLLGDSAHASLPNQAAGAGQGLEDALILSRLLIKAYTGLSTPATTEETAFRIRAAYEAYDEIRRPRAQRQIDSSIECGKLYNMAHPDVATFDERVDNLNNRFDWLWDHDLDGDVTTSERRYDEILRKTA